MNSIRTLFLVVLWCGIVSGQTIPPNKYGLQVVTTVKQYNQLTAGDSMMKLVDLKKYLPGVKLDIRYATTNNFTKKQLYNSVKAFVRLPVAKALQKVRKELRKKNIDLKIYDAYRPYSVTVAMWEYVKDDRYAAAPDKGSRHNRGCALDLTLVDARTGEDLEMPTEYDSFTVKSHDNYTNLPAIQIKNRKILRDSMEKAGFVHTSSEWWHFDFRGWNKYHLMDIAFDELP